MSDQQRCFYCGQSEGLSTCEICKEAQFCSEEHKKFHCSITDNDPSKGHCFPFRIYSSPSQGRFVKATRDIQPGEIILIDLAFTVGPLFTKNPVCLECHTSIMDYSIDKCEKCEFPLCKKTCQNSSRHSKLECPILTAKKQFFSTGDTIAQLHYGTGFINTLRLLLLSTDVKVKSTWSMVVNLLSHSDKAREDKDTWLHVQKTVVTPIRDILELKHFSEEDILRCHGILKTNGSRLDLGRQHGKSLGLFPTYSLVNHSCLYNATTTKKLINGEFCLKMVASRGIAAGEEIFSHYVSSNHGTFKRQWYLQKKWHFTCHCQRCLDPTEFGSMANGVKCKKCPGFLLPADPLDLQSVWTCQGCEVAIEAKVVADLHHCAEIELKRIEWSNLALQEMCCLLTDLLKKFTRELFHENHGFANEIREKLALILNTETRRLLEICHAEQNGSLKRRMVDNIVSMRLQQLTILVKFNEVINTVDPSQNLQPVVNKLRTEFKSAVTLAKALAE